jgi:hypothetical protein
MREDSWKMLIFGNTIEMQCFQNLTSEELALS